MARTRGSRAITCSSSADAGHRRSEGCGGESRRTASRSPREPPRAPESPPPLPGLASDPSPLEPLEGTRVGRMPGLALSGAEEETGLDEIELWPGLGGREGLEGDEGRPAPP